MVPRRVAAAGRRPDMRQRAARIRLGRPAAGLAPASGAAIGANRTAPGRDTSTEVPVVAAPRPSPSLGTLLREDLRAHHGAWSTPGFQAMAVYRFGRWAMGLTGPARKVAGACYFALYTLVRNLYGIEIPRTVVIGRRFHIGHQHGISIHGGAVIGDDCVVRNNVTFGVGAVGRSEAAPRVGDRVSIGPGAVLMGGITVGDDVVIGPNAIVSTNVPAGSVVFLPPTRILRRPSAAAADGTAAEPAPADRAAAP